MVEHRRSRRDAVELAYHPQHVSVFVEVDGDEIGEPVTNAPARLSAPQQSRVCIHDRGYRRAWHRARVDPVVGTGTNTAPHVDRPGDSAFIAPKQKAEVTLKVTAKPGTTLYFMCAVHPWMSAKLKVVKK